VREIEGVQEKGSKIMREQEEGESGQKPCGILMHVHMNTYNIIILCDAHALLRPFLSPGAVSLE